MFLSRTRSGNSAVKYLTFFLYWVFLVSGLSEIEATEDLLPHLVVETPLPPKTQNIIPDWYRANRVHAHTRLWLIDMIHGPTQGLGHTPEFRHAGQGMRSMGANVMTRHVKTMYEDPWWPSAVPVNPDGSPPFLTPRKIGRIQLETGEDLVRDMVAEAHASGMKMIAYMWHMSDIRSQKLHPEWACKNAAGHLLRQQYKRVYLDISSGFGDIVATRLRELQDRGVDGIYLDYRHFPVEGCFGSNLEQEFLAAYPQFRSIDRNSRHYLINLRRFQSVKMVEILANWRENIQAGGELAYLTSVTSLPTLINPEMAFAQLRTGIPKTEFSAAIRRGLNLHLNRNFPDLRPLKDEWRMALGWTLMRELSGAPPHVWGHGIPNRDQVLAYMGSVITFGGVANLDVINDNILEAKDPDGATRRADLEFAFRLGAEISPVMQDAIPLHDTAILFSEQARDAAFPHLNRIWKEQIWPTTAVFGFLQAQGNPATIIDEAKLDSSNNRISTIIVINPADISQLARDALARLAARGTRIINLDGLVLYTADEPEEILEAELGPFLAARSAEIKVSDIPDRFLIEFYKSDTRNSFILSVTNEFAWTQTQLWYQAIPADEINSPPAPLEAGTQVVFSDTSQTYCAFDHISGKPIERSADGPFVLPEIAQWALIEFNPC